MERKLAHVEVIENLAPIPGADKIEVATILGWQCVVKKGEFKVGEKVVYIEVDSVLPNKPEFEFLRDRKFRIRTIKLRGQISQGLVLPLSTTGLSYDYFSIGHDVTELLGITKYLSPSEATEYINQTSIHWATKYKFTNWLLRYKWFRSLVLPSKTKGGFPNWISKTDEERIQNMPSILTKYADSIVYITEKIDYQSATFTTNSRPRFNNRIGKYFYNKLK